MRKNMAVVLFISSVNKRTDIANISVEKSQTSVPWPIICRINALLHCLVCVCVCVCSCVVFTTSNDRALGKCIFTLMHIDIYACTWIHMYIHSYTLYIHCIQIPEIVPRKNSPKDWKSVRSKM